MEKDFTPFHKRLQRHAPTMTLKEKTETTYGQKLGELLYFGRFSLDMMWQESMIIKNGKSWAILVLNTPWALSCQLWMCLKMTVKGLRVVVGPHGSNTALAFFSRFP